MRKPINFLLGYIYIYIYNQQEPQLTPLSKAESPHGHTLPKTFQTKSKQRENYGIVLLLLVLLLEKKKAAFPFRKSLGGLMLMGK